MTNTNSEDVTYICNVSWNKFGCISGAITIKKGYMQSPCLAKQPGNVFFRGNKFLVDDVCINVSA